MGYPRGAAMELLDGTPKLLHCTRLFSKSFPPWNLPRMGRSPGVGKRFIVTPGNLLDCRGNFGKRVRLTRKTRPGIPFLSHPVSGHGGHPTPRRWKRLLRSSGGGEPRNIFPRLGVE